MFETLSLFLFGDAADLSHVSPLTWFVLLLWWATWITLWIRLCVRKKTGFWWSLVPLPMVLMMCVSPSLDVFKARFAVDRDFEEVRGDGVVGEVDYYRLCTGRNGIWVPIPTIQHECPDAKPGDAIYFYTGEEESGILYRKGKRVKPRESWERYDLAMPPDRVPTVAEKCPKDFFEYEWKTRESRRYSYIVTDSFTKNGEAVSRKVRVSSYASMFFDLFSWLSTGSSGVGWDVSFTRETKSIFPKR